MLFADGDFQLVVIAMVADFRGESGKQGELGLKKTFEYLMELARFSRLGRLVGVRQNLFRQGAAGQSRACDGHWQESRGGKLCEKSKVCSATGGHLPARLEQSKG